MTMCVAVLSLADFCRRTHV